MNFRAALASACVLASVSMTAGCSGRALPPAPVGSPPSSTEPAPPTTAAAPTAAAGQDWQSAATSLQGRPLRVLTLGSGPRRVVFIGGIHGDEAEGAYSTAQLPAAFESAGLGGAVALTILEDANPDGRAAGTRGNAAGVDLNRNFPAKNFDASNPAGGGEPLSQNESRAVLDLIDRVRPELVMVMHSWHGREFINFDGPAKALAERFSAASGIPVTASTEFPATPGSLGSYFGRDRGVAVLTVELLKGSDPSADWDKIRQAVLEAIAGR